MKVFIAFTSIYRPSSFVFNFCVLLRADANGEVITAWVLVRGRQLRVCQISSPEDAAFKLSVCVCVSAFVCA